MRRLATFAGIAVFFAILSAPAIRLAADAPTYTVEDLGTTSDGYVPSVTGINADGQVSGTASRADGQRAVRYTNGAGFEYLAGLTGATSVASAIAAHGDVGGYALTSAGQRAFDFSDTTGAVFVDPPSGGTFTLGWAINDLGTVAGYTNSAVGVRAYRKQVGLAIEVLPTLGSTTLGFAINGNGQVAGMSVTTAGVQHAFRANIDGTIDDLGSLAPGVASIANAIDGSGDVVGKAVTAAGVFHAFRYTTAMQDIDTLGTTFSNATAVNGKVTVGNFQAADGSTHAFVHTAADGMIDLNSRIPADSGWVLMTATGVNANGQITGMGMLNGVQRAYRLTPDQVPDTTPPVIGSVIATPSSIWPPNGAMVPVTIAVTATDDVDASPACALTSITGPGVDADRVVTGTLSGSVRAVGGRTYVFNVSCQDAAGNHSESSTNVVVPPDTTAPTITSLSVTPSAVWPPNGKMVNVTVSVTATDDVDASPVCAISSITATEPVPADATITGALTASVRSIKNSDGTTRVYTLHVTCGDDAGNTVEGTATVTVTKDGSFKFMKATPHLLIARAWRRHFRR